MLDALGGLVDKSLVVPDPPGQAGRYGMLETTRQYAAERLAESAEEAAVRRRHADYFLAAAEQAEPRLFGPQQNIWLARLEGEQGNLRAALAYLRDQAEGELGLRLAGALWRFWEVRGQVAEGQARLSEMLRLAGRPADPETEPGRAAAHARARLGAGVCGYYQRDYGPATAHLAESLRLYRALGDRQGMARTLFCQGCMANDCGVSRKRAPCSRKARRCAGRSGTGRGSAGRTAGWAWPPGGWASLPGPARFWKRACR